MIFLLVCLYFIKVCLTLWSNQSRKPSSLVCLLTAVEIPFPLQQPNFSCVKLASASFSIIWSFSGSVQSNYRPILLLQEMLPPPFLQCVKQCWVVWGGSFSIPVDPGGCDKRGKPKQNQPLYQCNVYRWNSTERWLDTQFR